jgi:gamma-glutamyltranspeptidase/glutathione hydrolase
VLLSAALCAAALLSYSAARAGGSMHPVHATHGMVVSVNEYGSAAGVEVMKQGGNAIDAAVATGFALAVVHPSAGNLGGGGFMLIRLKDGQTHFIDYREAAPARASATMYQDAHGNLIPKLSTVGYKASGVPGSVKGLVYAEQHFGKLGLAKVMAPAIRLAHEGYELSWDDAKYMSNERYLGMFPDSRRIFQNDGKGWHQGDRLKQPELARTLERIAANPDDFYHGQIARQLAEFMQAGGGLITTEDLARYEVKDRAAVKGNYRGLEVISAPPPSSGGIALIEALNILEGYDLGTAGRDSAKSVHLMAEAERRAFYDRAQFLGDPDFTSLSAVDLLDKKYATAWRDSIEPDQATPSSALKRPNMFPDLEHYAEQHPIGLPGPESPQTTHYSVVDSDGNAVAVTTTLNASFGSRVTVGPLGFLMNDEMDDFSTKVGAPNMFGLVQGAANAIAPGKRPLSSMTPTIVLKNGKLWLVLGTPGGPTIINQVLGFLVGVEDYGLDIQEAVNAPRLHHQWLPDQIFMERDRFSPDTLRLLEAQGYHIASRGESYGDGECIEVDSGSGELLGASDFRNDTGQAVGY